MPEDVPVRTCINVMVGITRSKVICFFGVWRLDWLSTNINTRSHRHREAPKRTPALRKSKQSFLQLDADLGGADPLSPSFFQIGSSQDLSSTFAAAHSEAEGPDGNCLNQRRTFNIFNMERYGELWHSNGKGKMKR